MNKLVIAFFAVLAVASAGHIVPAVPAIAAAPAVAAAPILGAPLLPKVRYNAAEVTVVKQPVTVTQPEVRYRNVPVPYSVPYAVPYSVPYPVPVAHHAVVPHAIAHHGVAHHAVAYAAPYAHHNFAYGAPIVKVH